MDIFLGLKFFLIFSLSLSLNLCFVTKSNAADVLNPLVCASSEIPFITSQYIFIGEDHRDYKSKQFLIDYLPVFKSMGYKSIFVEYIESKDQQVLNLFNENPILNREKVFRTYGLPGDWGYDPEPYLLLTDAIGYYGIDIYGLDRRSDLRLRIDPDIKMAIRDQHMFKIANQHILRNPSEKIIFLNGSSHSFKNTKLLKPSFYELFRKFYVNRTTTNIKIDYYTHGSLSLERLMVVDKSSANECPSDYFLFQPSQKRAFDFYIFENSKKLLPTINIPHIFRI